MPARVRAHVGKYFTCYRITARCALPSTAVTEKKRGKKRRNATKTVVFSSPLSEHSDFPVYVDGAHLAHTE